MFELIQDLIEVEDVALAITEEETAEPAKPTKQKKKKPVSATAAAAAAVYHRDYVKTKNKRYRTDQT